MISKFCTICKKNKNICEFSGSKSSRCTNCNIVYMKEYYEKNKKRISEQKKQYRKKNKDKISEQKQNYYINNKEKINEYKRRWEKNKRDTDIFFKLKQSVRHRINTIFSRTNMVKSKSSYELIGMDIVLLKKYLEEQFTVGMSWDNYGDWHIDHIIPLSSAKTEKELYKLCHYTNLQPLWAKDNIKKSNKIPQ